MESIVRHLEETGYENFFGAWGGGGLLHISLNLPFLPAAAGSLS